MDTSCFFVENLLSDFIEGALPSSRHEDVKSHLAGCERCSVLQRRLKDSLDILHSVRLEEMNSELVVRVAEAATSHTHPRLSWKRVTTGVLALSVLGGIFWGVTLAFPGLLPDWITSLHPREEANFVRYFPLQQGGQEILEEQSTWLHTREVAKGSLWEEGGLSPQEFEKAFQVRKKGAGGDDSTVEE